MSPPSSYQTTWYTSSQDVLSEGVELSLVKSEGWVVPRMEALKMRFEKYGRFGDPVVSVFYFLGIDPGNRIETSWWKLDEDVS